jgi:hypothetical protein
VQLALLIAKWNIPLATCFATFVHRMVPDNLINLTPFLTMIIASMKYNAWCNIARNAMLNIFLNIARQVA